MANNELLTQKESISEEQKGRVLKGIVVSDKMTKTIVVKVSSLKKHPKYKKYFKVSKKYKVHDEENKYHTGEEVLIRETKPMSKEKRWIVISKIETSNKETSQKL